MNSLYQNLAKVSGVVALAFSLIYFFENLPLEVEIAALQRTAPATHYFYQNGLLHTLVQNVECNILHIPAFEPIDAAVIYNFLQRKQVKALLHSIPSAAS